MSSVRSHRQGVFKKTKVCYEKNNCMDFLGGPSLDPHWMGAELDLWWPQFSEEKDVPADGGRAAGAGTLGPSVGGVR